MATARKAVVTSKKAPAKSIESVKSSTKAQNSVKSRITITDLRRKITDPKNRRTVILALGIIILAIVIYFAKGLFVVATVNGQPVSRISIIQDLERQSGSMVLESLITKMLVFQEAQKKKIEASSKDIDAEIAKISKQFKDQGQDLDQLLAAQGLTKEKFREEVRIQILVTKLLGDQAKVTDKEFADFLNQNKDLITAEQDKKTAEANLRIQMDQQKLAQKYQEWIANIKKSAKVQYFVNY